MNLESCLVSEALKDYYLAAKVDPASTYDEKWARIEVGPIAFYIPNTENRKNALRVHDVHHVVTGFEPNICGEAQISAWEVGSGGCGTNLYVWAIILTGAVGGLFICPIKTFRAFLLGIRSKNLFGENATQFYSSTIRQVRQQLNLPI